MSHRQNVFNHRRYEHYASLTDPDKVLPRNIYCWHTERTLTIQEHYNKSNIHVIMIPRVGSPPRVPVNLRDLRTWLNLDARNQAKALLEEMREDLEVLKGILAEEMESHYRYVSNFWAGFKVAPSYSYLHLHVMSDDLTGEYMKLPKHFFSFHPEHGEFYHLDEVLSWFDIVEERYQDHLKELKRKRLSLTTPHDAEGHPRPRPVYDCYHNDGIECRFTARDLPTMKAHLEEHAERTKAAFIRRKQAREERERRRAAREARLAEAQGQESIEPDAGQSSLT